jgi:thiol-disulfide isomerase/thioredoxin
MKKYLLVAALLAAAGMAPGIAADTPTVAADSYPPIVTDKKLYAKNDIRGQTAPQLEVQKWLSGAAPDTDNKVVLIDFWSTWCPPCRELIPELNGYQKKFAKDLVVIGISDEEADTIKEFMKSHKMDYNVAIDGDNKMYSKIGISGIPHVIIISPDHIVRWQGFPQTEEDPLTEEKIAQIIKTSLGH